jgi:adenylosuccinate synthase
MPAYVVVGTQWGDEGKGKIVDFLSDRADVIARYQGGNNAGHTVVINDEEYILHLVPTGILHPDKVCVVGNGTVIDPEILAEEIAELEKRGVAVAGRLFISQNAHLITPYHKMFDEAQEALKGTNKLGTTKRGIGPAYADKADRAGIRTGDLLDETVFREKLESVLALKNVIAERVFNKTPLKTEDVIGRWAACARKLGSYLADTSSMVNDALDAGKTVLFEGAQGTMLDVDHGTYPYVTSSNTVAGAACAGIGVGPTRIDGVIAVVKAYTTRVGSGPFPTEQHGAVGEHLREKGYEYGRTTGRPRRCGWFDAPLVRRALLVNSPANVALTKIDVLGGMDSIKVCVAYRYNGTEVRCSPENAGALGQCEPIYEEVDSWADDISSCDSFKGMPKAAQKYVRYLEDLLDCPISIISTGAARDTTIVFQDPFCK